MITLKEWMELVDYRVTEGSDWYGNVPDLYSLSSWDGCQDGHSSNIVFDPTDNQYVYTVEICDYKNNRAYRLTNSKEAGVKIDTDKEAWDGVDFVDLESDEDFIEKAQSIIAGETYDTRVTIPIDLPDEELFKYMTAAHEMDITFNQFVERALQAVIDEHNAVK